MKKKKQVFLSWAINVLYVLFLFSAHNLNAFESKETKSSISEEEKLAQLCWDYRYNNPDSARYFGDKALLLAKKNNNLNIVAIAYHNLAISYEAQSKFKEAIELNLKSLEIKKKIRDEVGIAN